MRILPVYIQFHWDLTLESNRSAYTTLPTRAQFFPNFAVRSENICPTPLICSQLPQLFYQSTFGLSKILERWYSIGLNNANDFKFAKWQERTSTLWVPDVQWCIRQIKCTPATPGFLDYPPHPPCKLLTTVSQRILHSDDMLCCFFIHQISVILSKYKLKLMLSCLRQLKTSKRVSIYHLNTW